jgi:hypothetical protein
LTSGATTWYKGGKREEVTTMTEEKTTVQKKEAFIETPIGLTYASALGLASVIFFWFFSGLLISLF